MRKPLISWAPSVCRHNLEPPPPSHDGMHGAESGSGGPTPRLSIGRTSSQRDAMSAMSKASGVQLEQRDSKRSACDRAARWVAQLDALSQLGCRTNLQSARRRFSVGRYDIVSTWKLKIAKSLPIRHLTGPTPVAVRRSSVSCSRACEACESPSPLVARRTSSSIVYQVGRDCELTS